MINLQKLKVIKKIREAFRETNNYLDKIWGSYAEFSISIPEEDNLFEWRFILHGSQYSLYKNGLFYLKITFPDDYPNTKPKIVFLTPIYHLNVKFYVDGDEPLGHINDNSLNNWMKEEHLDFKNLPSILLSLLYQNNPENCYDYNDHRRKNEYINNKSLFEEKAAYFTKKYANIYEWKKEYSTDWDFTYNQ